MNNMLGYLRNYKRESVLAPLFKMLEATFDLFVPLVMADIVNVGIAAHDLHYILVRCGILLLLAVIGLTCSLTAQYFSAKAAVGYSTALRHALFAHIQSLSFSEMDTLGTSTLITRMTSDINQVQSGLNLFLRLFLRSPFVVIGAMVMAFTVNARAALIFVVAIPLLSVVVFGVMVITRPLYKTAQVRLDRVLGLTRENLTGVRVVRAFDKEQDEIDRFENANDLLTRMQLHVGHLSALMSPLTYVIINIAIVALLYVGSIEINVGGMASGDVIALVNYMNQILVELVKLANLIVQVSKALACAGRVQAVLDTKPGMEFPAQLTGNVPAETAGDAVRFDHVSLTYKGAGAPSLSDISFTAKRGQTIGVIGGTGMVGQRFITLMEHHPWFQLTAIAASARSAGKPYAEAVAGRWALDVPMPEEAKNLVVLDAEQDAERLASMVDFCFCAVDMKKEEIRALEEKYARLECPIVSNNSAHRWTDDVPMVVPEINADHLAVIEAQRKRLGTRRGFIAVKSNCSLQSYVPALHPLKKYGLDKILVCTYQAISGAGKTFQRWPEMVDNCIPYIGGEEEKSEQEPLKLWGRVEDGKIVRADGPSITAQCFRVACQDGHMAAVFMKFADGKAPSMEQIKADWAAFRGVPQELELPSAPKQFLHYFEENDRPQPKLDRMIENGMAVSIGRLREDTQYDYKFVCLSHNTLRGAAGGAVLLAELLAVKGYFD